MNYEKGYFDTQEFRELLKKYEQATAMGMHAYFSIDEFVDLSSYYLYIEKHEKAEEVLNFSKQIHPAAGENTKMEIRLLLSKGEPQKALELFSGIEFADDSETRILHAEILLALKEYKKAYDIAYRLIKESTPEEDNLYEALEILLDCGFALETLQMCDKALKHMPGNRSLLEVKAESLIELQRTNEAIELYNTLLDDTPYSTFYWEQLGRIYFMTGKYGKALECFEFESTINDEIEYPKMMMGHCYYRAGNYAKAEAQFAWLVERYPQSALPQFYIALCEFHSGNRSAAAEHFREIIDKATEGTIEAMLARANKAMILDAMGMGERAEEAISMAIMMHPDNMQQFMLPAPHLYELRDKENLSFSDMNILEQKEWNQEESLYRFGTHLYRHGHPALALRVFRYIRPFSFDTSDIDAYIARILWERGDKESAETAIENAMNGKSCQLFTLFGITFDPEITLREFIARIQ